MSNHLLYGENFCGEADKHMIAHSHTLQLYRDERFLIELATALIKVRLDRRESVLVIMTSNHIDRGGPRE